MCYKGAMNNITEEEKDIAITLHEALCCGNHTDHCGWFYEDWEGWTHQKYLKIARKILQNTDFNTAKKIIKIMGER